MRTLFIALLCSCITTLSSAQIVDEIAGKTYYYYDQSNKKMKEVFHHKQMVAILPDPNNRGSYIDSTYYIKNGPYTRYHENGNLECSGYYRDEKKDRLWKYYNTKGELIREERYENGKLLTN